MRLLLFALLMVTALAAALPCRSQVVGPVGPYRVALTTDPAVIPIGKVRLALRITDAAGAPVPGATVRALVKMPTMTMGEKETLAVADGGTPGLYTTEASFMMAGAYEARLQVSGPAGQASGALALRTGQDTSQGVGPLGRLLGAAPWLLGVAVLAFTLFRMRRTGQRLSLRRLAEPGVLGGLLLLAAGIAGSVYAVNNWRRPGAMTPIEAQAMEMNTPAPPGAAPVTLARVEVGPVRDATLVTGQAVAFNEQALAARVQGWLLAMPFYVGDAVSAGQVVARLDTGRLDPPVADRRAGATMAGQAVAMADRERMQAAAEAEASRAELAGKRQARAAAGDEAEGARAELAEAEAGAAVAARQVTTARAQVAADEAEQAYWTAEIARERRLLAQGAVPAEELDRELAQAAAVDARVKQARAGLEAAEAEVAAAAARTRRARAGAQAAEKRAQQMAADVGAAEAGLRAATASEGSAQQRAAMARSGARQAAAGLAAATTERGYAEVRARISGVVTQRLAAPGALVAAGQPIITVAQVAPIRLQANVPQALLPRVRPGGDVRVRPVDDAGGAVTARITSVAPSLDPVARTAVVEALAPNADRRFAPGQFVAMDVGLGGSRRALRLPNAAVRIRPLPGAGVGPADQAAMVWVAEAAPGEPGRFTVRAVRVRTGATDNTHTEAVAGLKAGQLVVLAGGENLREGDTVTASAPPSPGPARGAANAATVEVSSEGYRPSELTFRAGVPARITFIRRDEQNCGQELVVPEYGIRRDLPLGKPVTVTFTPRRGSFTFTCGMAMLRGTVVAR